MVYVLQLVWVFSLFSSTDVQEKNNFCTGKAAVVQDRAISDMISSMELQRSRFTPILPQWDLGIVLEALNKSLYEPLREAFLKHLNLKQFSFLLWTKQSFRALVFDSKHIQLKPKGAGYILVYTNQGQQRQKGAQCSHYLQMDLHH